MPADRVIPAVLSVFNVRDPFRRLGRLRGNLLMKPFFALFTCMMLILPTFADDQTICPIMIDTEIDKEEKVEYKGKTIYMCCAACVRAWEANPDYYVAAAAAVKTDKPLLPQLEGVELPEVELMAQRFCPVLETAIIAPESPSIEYKGKKIYFFKSSYIRRWNRDPDGNFEKARKAGLLPQYDE